MPVPYCSTSQQIEQIRRQEKMVETTQRKLAEKIEETSRRNEELVSALAKIQDISFITVKVDDFIEAIRDGALPNEVRSALVEVPNKPSVSIRDIK